MLRLTRHDTRCRTTEERVEVRDARVGGDVEAGYSFDLLPSDCPFLQVLLDLFQ